MRAEKQKEYDLFVQAEKRSRLVREEEMAAEQRVLEEEKRKKSEALAASRRVELEKQIRVKEDVERENIFLLEEQKKQKQLEAELKEIDLEIGVIYDARDQRKKDELAELEKLDEKIFKLRQELRGSKVRQLALEEELFQLSKVIVN